MPQELKVNPGTRVDHVGRSGVYPASGPLPEGPAPVRGQGELGHPEEQRRLGYRAAASGRSAVLMLGRALFGGYFVYNGINHFMNRGMMAGYARSKGVESADAAVLGSGALIILGGASLLTGVQPKAGAALIAAFLLGVTPRMHAFWEADGEEKMSEMVNFTKNIALIGGACFAAVVPEPWPASVNVR